MIALDNDPLFATHTHDSVLPLTDSMVRKHLKRVLALLGLQNDGYTFHTFRRSGASWAYNHGVPMEAIKYQGTWVSDTGVIYMHIPLLHLLYSRPLDSTYCYDGCLGCVFRSNPLVKFINYRVNCNHLLFGRGLLLMVTP